jgi:large subunit ribosomal protein L31
MKSGIHPNYDFIEITMTDGSTFRTRSVIGGNGAKMQLDIDPKSHPAWTGGQQKVLDSGGMVGKFNKRFGSFKLGK